MKSAYGFTIFKNAEGNVVYQPHGYCSQPETIGEPVVLVPTFPQGFPGLRRPKAINATTRRDTLHACEFLNNSEHHKARFTQLFDNFYSIERAQEITDNISVWIESITALRRSCMDEETTNTASVACLTVSGLSSSASTALAKGQLVAVRPDKSNEPFYIGKISRVLHGSVQVRWYQKYANNIYKIMGKNRKDPVVNGAIITTNVVLSKKGRLTAASQRVIMENL